MQTPFSISLLIVCGIMSGCSFGPRQDLDPEMIFPAPRFFSKDGSGATRLLDACVDTGALPQHALLDTRVPQLIVDAGLLLKSRGCEWSIAFSSDTPPLSAEAMAVYAGGDDNPERYVVVTTAHGASLSTTIQAASERAALYGLRAALSMPQPVTIVDWPSFAKRGMIEGYYGTPLSPSARKGTLRRMEALRQNTYLYGPKDDVFARLLWADPYPDDVGQEISDAAKEARVRLIDFIWSLSPGLSAPAMEPGQSIVFSSSDDFDRLTAKIESVRMLGVDRFALFLDDLTPNLVWDADRVAFSSPAAAHASLMNRLQRYLLSKDASARLLVVGTAYASEINGWRDYNETLGALLRPDIDVMWTGPTTFSQEMKASDMDAIDGRLARRVVIWDNWPEAVVPLRDRASDLPRTVSGFLSNIIMSQTEQFPISATWQVMGTLGDYQWSPDRYTNPDNSFATWQVRNTGF